MRGTVHSLGMMLLLSGGLGLFWMLNAAFEMLEEQFQVYSARLRPAMVRETLNRPMAVHQRIPFFIKP